VILGAAAGAPLRYLTDRAIGSRHRGSFPWSTLTVNVVACLVLGFVTQTVTAGMLSHRAQLLLGTGLCATLSTFSTFSYETVRLAEQGARLLAAANVILSVAGGLGAAFAGAGLASALWH
jgi:CrcB protein